MKHVRYIFPTSHHYRLPFHERLRELLAEVGIDYRVVYSAPGRENVQKRDTVDIAWGVKVPAIRIPGTSAIWQMAIREAVHADLVIVQQENRLLFNYACLLASILGAKRVAYFGHGRNFQARRRDSAAERFKRFWAKRADWWFAYTNETRQHLLDLGFPNERVTVFNNAVDTKQLRSAAEQVSLARVEQRRAEVGLTGRHVAIFVGGLYDDKRPDFLVAAADRIRAIIPDFEFLVVGSGASLPVLQAAATTRPWLKVLGPRFGIDKVELMLLGKLFLMPGLLGLAVLDAGALGLPVVTTAYPYHSPEIAYLIDGENGVIVADWQNIDAYANAVIELFQDDTRRQAMSERARAYTLNLTVEEMAARFARGVMAALA